MWVAEQGLNNVASITTTGGTVTEYPAPTPVAGVNDVVATPDGNIWFTENSVGRLARLTP